MFRVAKSQQYDIEGLVEIFRHYGDHLYAKGNHSGAMEQYLKTVGHLEPSYVIKRVGQKSFTFLCSIWK